MTRDYNDPFYKQVRSEVLKRDKFKCQMPLCKEKSRLQVHHVQPWAKASSMRFDRYNLITLCAKCHKSIKGMEHHYVSVFMGIIRENEGKK